MDTANNATIFQNYANMLTANFLIFFKNLKVVLTTCYLHQSQLLALSVHVDIITNFLAVTTHCTKIHSFVGHSTGNVKRLVLSLFAFS